MIDYAAGAASPAPSKCGQLQGGLCDGGQAVHPDGLLL